MEKKRLTPEEKWEQATLANDFLFYMVMRNHPDACQQLLEMLLKIKIDHMEMHNEAVINLENGAKGIRLDVYVKDTGRLFDIELQVTDTGELPERARYYASLMALDSLKSGEKYSELRDSHVIFICMEDIF
ncbi:MAG: Rpn family recombination-promoting nuclease/putative transposase, partial [Treponemataceae bacterium]|nr:Rpn family recombination-promoting nuclease/putative transposase [Treponemataceae bacterium]